MTSRREMLRRASCAFGALALKGLCAESVRDRTGPGGEPRIPVRPVRAKRVIFLCMSGGPAHLDTFDYKPQTGEKKHPGSAFDFRQHGESGLWISDLLPQTARHADKLCVLNGMYADTGNHAQSFLQLHTGEKLRKRPSMGNIRSDHLDLPAKRRQLDLVQAMNREHRVSRPEDPHLEGAIQSMELGFRMQTAGPDLMDLGRESRHTLERYRVGFKQSVGTCRPTDFGRQCLLARRFAEAGVRFIEVNHGGWDQHKNHRRDLKANCESTDAPIAALLEDLEQRGMLEDTLVVWGGEFGRPGLTPDDGKDQTGHNAKGFTFWLAGGGAKRGFVHGRTDDTGRRAVEGKMHFRDLHATILHMMGLDHQHLAFRHEGRDHRLTGPEEARVVTDILA
jgi:hypothetical protein